MEIIKNHREFIKNHQEITKNHLEIFKDHLKTISKLSKIIKKSSRKSRKVILLIFFLTAQLLSSTKNPLGLKRSIEIPETRHHFEGIYFLQISFYYPIQLSYSFKSSPFHYLRLLQKWTWSNSTIPAYQTIPSDLILKPFHSQSFHHPNNSISTIFTTGSGRKGHLGLNLKISFGPSLHWTIFQFGCRFGESYKKSENSELFDGVPLWHFRNL